MQSALGVKTEDEEGEDGLFALGARTFGQSAHLSQIVGHAQQAEGVRWVLAQAAQLIPPGTPAATDPTALSVPSPRVTAPALACNAAGILTLYIDHLELNLVADERKEACSA